MKKLNTFLEHTSHNKGYLKEVKLHNILDKIASVKTRSSNLESNIRKNKNLIDDVIKSEILDLEKNFMDSYDRIMNNILDRQKKSGKEFLSDNEIDDLVDNLINKSHLGG